MDASKLKVARQRLANEYEDLTQSLKRGRLAADEIKVENTEDEEGDLARLRSIEEAMEALDRGQYGECIRCDDDINEKRLEVVPWATMCVRCQEEVETEASSQSAMAGLERDGPEL